MIASAADNILLSQILAENYYDLCFVCELVGAEEVAFNCFAVYCHRLYAALNVVWVLDIDRKVLATEVLFDLEAVPCVWDRWAYYKTLCVWSHTADTLYAAYHYC